MTLNQNDTASLPSFYRSTKTWNLYTRYVYRRNWQSKCWLGGGKKLDILFSCTTRTGFSDGNSGPKMCAVSIANNGTTF